MSIMSRGEATLSNQESTFIGSYGEIKFKSLNRSAKVS